MTTGSVARPVAVITGGGAGIGAAITKALAARGAYVVTVDPMVSIDGTASDTSQSSTTIDEIVAAGGAGHASATSVTDPEGIDRLLAAVVRDHGRLDVVVNVAGISRPTSYGTGTEADWHAVLDVHVNGYVNVLRSALAIMSATGHGRIIGVTSGSGWRAADAGAYGCAKRCVAALTWQLGRVAPPGVSVNAISPIAVTRMVTAALGPRAGAAGAKTGGLSLGSMPEPDDLGPFATWLANDAPPFSGEVLFAGGTEIAHLGRPRLLETINTDGVVDIGALLDAVATDAFGPANQTQASTGGTNPRFNDPYMNPAGVTEANGTSCVIVTDRPGFAGELRGALERRGVTCDVTTDPGVLVGDRRPDAVVLAMAGEAESADGPEWNRVLSDHNAVAAGIAVDGLAVRDVIAAIGPDCPVRLITVTDGTTTGGRSRGQAATQLARSAQRTTNGAVQAFTITAEGRTPQGTVGAAELVAHLVAGQDPSALAAAELVAGDGYIGIRAHPTVAASFTFGTPDVPTWLGDRLREAFDVDART